MEDNPSLTPEIISRYHSLYNGTFYERFVEGKWVAAQGLVYPFFSSERHVCPVPQSDFECWYISCDYGTVNPTSMGLWGRSGGVWYRVKEFYFNSREAQKQMTDEEYDRYVRHFNPDRFNPKVWAALARRVRISWPMPVVPSRKEGSKP